MNTTERLKYVSFRKGSAMRTFPFDATLLFVILKKSIFRFIFLKAPSVKNHGKLTRLKIIIQKKDTNFDQSNKTLVRNAFF
jgi:hypothetical protein